MHEREPQPEQADQEDTIEGLHKQQINDLAVLWEQVGSGKPLEATGDLEQLRAAMWQDTKNTWLTEVLPQLKFRRKPELESAVVSTAAPAERAEQELALVRDYVAQLRQEKNSMGYSPALSKQTGYGVDCVGASAILIAVLEDAGVEVSSGNVAHHKVVLVRDALERLWYVDPRNGAIGEITSQGQQRPGGTLYSLSEQDRANTKAPFTVLVELSARDGVLHSMLGNTDVLAEQGYDYEEEGQREFATLYERNQRVLDTQDWGSIRAQLLPSAEQLLVVEEALWQRERVRIKAMYYELPSLTTRILSVMHKEKDFQQQIVAEAAPHKDSIVQVLAGNGTLPDELSRDVRQFFSHLRDELHSLNEEQRGFMLEEITRRLHVV